MADNTAQLKALAPLAKTVIADTRQKMASCPDCCDEGLIVAVEDLYTALTAGDIAGVGKAVDCIVHCLFGGDCPCPTPVMKAAAIKVDWQRLLTLLLQVLPLIFPTV